MPTLNCIETYIDRDQNHYGCFLIEPLETGQGITLGNALRRTLLSDLTGFSVVGVRINNVKHEFSTIEGLREDILEILLNLKEVVFKQYVQSSHPTNISKITAFLNVKGPVILTAGLFNLPKNSLKIINPNHYLGTIIDNSEFYMEIDIENGKGYRLVEETRKKDICTEITNLIPSTLFIDALFMPVKRVNYKVKVIHDTQGNIKESLNLEIWTNGSTTPKRSLQEAIKILMNLFYSLFITPDFLKISSELAKKFLKKEKKITKEIVTKKKE